MALIYPDNRNRANRVSQLATQIETLQHRFSDLLDSIATKDDRTLVVLNRLLRAAGFRTLEEFINVGLDRLTPEQRAEFQQMQEQVKNFDQTLVRGMDVAGGLMAVAALSGVTATGIRVLASLSMVRTSFATMALGLVNVLRGNVALGLAMLRSAGRAISTALIGSGLSARFVTAARLFRNVGRSLTAVSIVLTGILLIFGAIQGARQRTELQNAIVELSARRFDVMKIDLSITATNNFTDSASGLINLQESMNGLVAAGHISQGVADAAVADSIQTAIGTIQEGMEVVTNDRAWDSLTTLDDRSGIAWRNEDPTLAQVLQWIEDHFDEEVTATVRWRIENPGSEQSKEMIYYLPKEEIFSRDLKEGDKVSVSVVPAKL